MSSNPANVRLRTFAFESDLLTIKVRAQMSLYGRVRLDADTRNRPEAAAQTVRCAMAE